VLRTSVPAETLPATDVVRSYKQLKEAERDFKTIKGPELEIRPIHHRLDDRVRAHVLICMLACYLTWHLKQAWAELLFKDEYPPRQTDPVAKATRSPQAERKARTRRTTRGDAATRRTRCARCSTSSRPRPATPSAFTKPTRRSTSSPHQPSSKPALAANRATASTQVVTTETAQKAADPRAASKSSTLGQVTSG
jgi:hypothetical protein